jgi:hypothetical protein
MPISAAAALVESNLNARQWCKEQFYINAMHPDYDIARSGCNGLAPDWQLLTGWCAGAITGYALLKVGDDLSKERSRSMLDLIARGGISPSGLFWSVYAGGKWDPIRNNIPYYQHMRMPGDAAFYYLKSIELERTRGIEHPDWERAAISNLDAFVQLWDKYHEFGHRGGPQYARNCGISQRVWALCIGALALASRMPRGEEYLRVGKEAADAFYDRFVCRGWIAGGPDDTPIAPDSESVMMLLESYVVMYEVTQDAKYLRYAKYGPATGDVGGCI